MIYPFSAGWAVWIWVGMAVARATARWRSRIKDEVYLIGERLHNFGETGKKALPEPKTAFASSSSAGGGGSGVVA
jgi:E3 ubiquitin-protein ligase MARCH6